MLSTKFSEVKQWSKYTSGFWHVYDEVSAIENCFQSFLCKEKLYGLTFLLYELNVGRSFSKILAPLEVDSNIKIIRFLQKNDICLRNLFEKFVSFWLYLQQLLQRPNFVGRIIPWEIQPLSWLSHEIALMKKRNIPQATLTCSGILDSPLPRGCFFC